MFALIRPFRALAKALQANDSPRQLALGAAIGMLIGLMPKGNLTAWFLIAILFSTQVNRGVGLCAAFLFTWVGSLVDPLSHGIGLAVLNIKMIEPLFTWLADLPVVPWTSFNNTIVMGSLLLGAGLFYPTYRVSKYLFETYTPVVVEKLHRFKIYQVLFGTEFATRWKV